MTLLKKLMLFRREARAVGCSKALKLAFAKTGTMLDARVGDYDVFLRARSSDLRVAMESLLSEYAFLDNLFPTDYEALFVDAGGYIGTSAISIAKRFPNVTVVTIEPSSENFVILQKNIAPYPNIVAKKAALDVSGGNTVTLNNRGTGNWGFTTISNPDDTTTVEKLERAPTVSLTEIATEMGQPISFLKLDIEGGEKAIFDAASEQLDPIPFVFVELHDRIVDSCKTSFMTFSRNRWVLKMSGEKFLSLTKAS